MELGLVGRGISQKDAAKAARAAVKEGRSLVPLLYPPGPVLANGRSGAAVVGPPGAQTLP
ncbi:MAG: hypothetical protein M1814_006247, partial [Vezdaea aestivalis]